MIAAIPVFSAVSSAKERDLVQDIDGLVHPAALVPRAGKDLIKRLPEAERAVTNGNFRAVTMSHDTGGPSASFKSFTVTSISTACAGSCRAPVALTLLPIAGLSSPRFL
jgi:hypothetical protein